MPYGAINTMGDTPAASLPAGPPAFRSEKMKIRKTIVATWNGQEYISVLEEAEIVSIDGDNWTYGDGLPVGDGEFQSLQIRLTGGPRDGIIVA